ncbi:MAG: hypothetical protein K2X57_27860 [Xanthobacteraceae bacterium]|nr:hypothetical protein [Xanthobacteraceae bacterium]
MRKLILISAFVLASVSGSISAQAGDSRSLILAANDTPAASTTAPATASTATTAPETTAADTATSKKQASKSQKKPQARRETDEQKARRIASKYGVYW